MTYAADVRLRPAPDLDHRTPSRQRRLGIGIALIGLLVTLVAFVANLAVVNGADPGPTLAWSFGLTTTGFATIKLAIAVVLWGILMRLWLRADSVTTTLHKLIGKIDDDQSKPVSSEFGPIDISDEPPTQLPIHRMAKRMFRPMLLMGGMLVAAGLIAAIVEAASFPSSAASAWKQGLQFLGEGMVLAGISFFLGTILWALRTAGGEVQAAIGARIQTPRMPATAKAFVVLMMSGLIISIVQFVGYVTVANSEGVATAFAWLGPLREVGLGLLLAGIALALVTIGNILGFQYRRIGQLIDAGERS